LGVDETAFLAANGKHHTEFVTGMVDVTASRLLDVVHGRSGTVLCQWISAQPQPWRDGITVAALDQAALDPTPPMFVKRSAGWVRVGRVRFG
jgi:hypothetical protein